MNPLFFRIYTDFEADNGFDKSSTGRKTTNSHKQKPILNGYPKVFELEDVFKSGYYKSPLGYDSVDWFVEEVKRLENKIVLYLKIIIKILKWLKKMNKIIEIKVFVDFVKKKIFLIK